MSDKKEITITELAAEMREGFKRIDARFTSVQQGLETLNAKIDNVEEGSQEFRKYAKGRFDDLENGLFTEKQKEEILAMVRHYDRWLEEDTRGETHITLTRSEYDALIDAVHLPNRFLAVEAE